MSALGRISNTIGSLGVNLNVDLDQTTMSAIQEQNIKINNIDQELDNLESELKDDLIGNLGTTSNENDDGSFRVVNHSVKENLGNLYHMLTGIAVATGQDEIAGPMIALEGLYDEANHLYDEGHSVYDAINNFKDLVGHPYNDNTVQAIDEEDNPIFEPDGTTPIYQEIQPTGLHKRAYDLEQMLYIFNTIEEPKSFFELIEISEKQYDYRNHLYVDNENDDGEIRFQTKEAYKWNDHNYSWNGYSYFDPLEVFLNDGEQYFYKAPKKPNPDDPDNRASDLDNRLDYNCKIGKDGRFYFWHNTYGLTSIPWSIIVAPTGSGFYEIDNVLNSIVFNVFLNQIQITSLSLKTTSQSISTGVKEAVKTATSTAKGAIIGFLDTIKQGALSLVVVTGGLVAGMAILSNSDNNDLQDSIRSIDKDINALLDEIDKIDKEIDNIDNSKARDPDNEPFDDSSLSREDLVELKSQYEDTIAEIKTERLKQQKILLQRVGFLHIDYLQESDFQLEEQTSTDVDGNTVVTYKLKSQKLTDVIEDVGVKKNTETGQPSTGIFEDIENVFALIGNEKIILPNGTELAGTAILGNIEELQELVGNPKTDTTLATGLHLNIDTIETDIGQLHQTNGESVTQQGSGLKYQVQKLEEIVGDDTSGGSTLVSKISTIETDIGQLHETNGETITQQGTGLRYQVQKLEEIIGDDTGTGSTLLTRVTDLETEIDMSDISTTRIDQLDQKVNAMREITGYDNTSLLYLLLPQKPDGTTYTISENEEQNHSLIDLGYKGTSLKENWNDFFDIYVMPHYSVSQAITPSNKYVVKDLVSGQSIDSYDSLEIIEKHEDYISTIRGKMKYNISLSNFYISMFLQIPESLYRVVYDYNNYQLRIRQNELELTYKTSTTTTINHLDVVFTDGSRKQMHIGTHYSIFMKYTNVNTHYDGYAFYIRRINTGELTGEFTITRPSFFTDQNIRANSDSYEQRPYNYILNGEEAGGYFIYESKDAFQLNNLKITASREWTGGGFTGAENIQIRIFIFGANSIGTSKYDYYSYGYTDINLGQKQYQSYDNTNGSVTITRTTAPLSFKYYLFGYSFVDSSNNYISTYDDKVIRFTTFQILNTRQYGEIAEHTSAISYLVDGIDFNEFNHLVVYEDGKNINFHINDNPFQLQVPSYRTPYRTSENILTIGDQYEYRGVGIKNGILDTADIEPISELSKTNYRVRIKELAVMDEVYVTESLILENPIQYRNSATGGTRRLAEQEDTSTSTLRRRLALEDETTSTPSTFVYLDEIILRDTVPTQNKIVIYDHTTSSFSITDDNLYQRTADAFDGNYSSLNGKPTLFDGNYNNLTNKPTLFDGNYNNLTNKPTLFDGNYSSLNGKPTLFDGNYNNLTNKPTLFDGVYSSLSGIPTLFDGNYNNLTNKPTLFDGNYSSLNGIPTLFDGNYNNLTNKPTLFDGNYNNLTNKPTLSDYQLSADTTANYYDKTEIDHKILGGVADDDFSSKNISGIVKHIYNDIDDHFLMVSQNLYPSEIVGLQEFMYNAITMESVRDQFPVLETFTADSFLELATDQKVLYITLTQYSPLTIEYQYGTGSVITHTYTTFNELGWPHWLNINISQYDYIALRITAPFEFRLRFEKYYLDPDYISVSTQSTSYTSPDQISQDFGSLYLHHDNGDGTGGYHRIINFILDPPRYQNKFQSSVIPADTTKIDYMDFKNIGGTHYLRIGRNQVYSDINLDVNLGWLAQANHNHDTVYAPLNHNHDGVYLKDVDDVFAFMDRAKFQKNADDEITLTANLSYFIETSSSGIGPATTTLNYDGNIDITGNLDCVNVTVDSLTFRDNSYITSASGLGGSGGGGVVNYTDIQVPTITETVPGNLITVDVTPTVAPDHYYIDQSPATEYTVLQTDATNLKAWYKFDDNIDDSTDNGNDLTALSGTVQLLNTQYKIGKSAYFTNDSLKMNTFTFHNKPFAVAFWVYKTEDGFFLIQRKANAVNQYLLIGSRYGGYELAFYGNDLQSTTGYTADMNTWVHLVYQIDASKNREIWRNGVRIANDTSTAFLNVDNNDVVIGNRTDNNDYFQGYLDDFRIYDTVLTADEISLLYNQKVLVNIEPEPIYADTTENLQYLAEQKTGVKGWRLVRFLPPTSSTWYSVNDNSFGTAPAYGTSYDYTNEWSVDYGGTFDEMFFSTKNMIYWLWTPKTSVEGNYSNAGRLVYKSSNNSSQHNVAWYNRAGTDPDPFISVLNHTTAVNQCLYAENSFASAHTQLIGGNEGMCVFVRTSTDTVTVNNDPDYKTLTFTNDGSSQTSYDLTFDNPTECDILIVGGGGAAGTGIGGGGGAGGVVYIQNYNFNSDTNYKIKVGNGGINTGIQHRVDGSGYRKRGVSGHDSGIYNYDNTNIIYTDNGANFPLIGYGGGGGGAYSGNTNTEIEPASGGSSGGMGCRNTSDITMSSAVVATQGNTYWDGTAFVPGGYLGGNIGRAGYSAAGGGGAGGVGLPAPDGENGGDGGVGIVNDITGIQRGYAGGGGGSTDSSTSTNMGRGGSVIIDGVTIYLGGDGIPYGTADNEAGGDGLPNTGSGGGGGGWSDAAELPGNGGSGIVIIRYKSTYTTGSAPVITQITPRGVLKYNTNDEWSLSTISQTDIADLEQNFIIVSLFNEISLLKSRVAVLESSGGGSVGNSVTFTFVYKFEYGIETVLTDGMLLTINNTRAKYKPNITLKLLDPIVGTNTYTYSVSKNESGTRTVIKNEPFSSLPVDTLTNSEILTNVAQGTSPLMYFDIIENGTSMLISEFYCTIHRENDIPLSATINISTSQIDIDVGLGETTTLTQVPQATIPVSEEQRIVLTLKDINLHIPDATANSQYELYMYNEIYTQWDLSKGVADLVNIDAGVYLFDVFNNGSSQYRLFGIKKTTEHSIVLSNTARQIRINY